MVGPSSYLNVWVGTERKAAIAVPTDANGVARLQLTLDSRAVNIPNPGSIGTVVVEHPVLTFSESLAINAPYASCDSGGSNYSWLGIRNLSMKEVLHRGYVSPNTCGKVNIPPQPGKVILFVRPLTFWEILKQ